MSDGSSPSEADESVVDDEKNVKAFVFFCQEGLGLPACSKTEEFGPKLAERLKAIKKTLDIQFRLVSLFFFAPGVFGRRGGREDSGEDHDIHILCNCLEVAFCKFHQREKIVIGTPAG